jgi:ABC-type phosphate transport system auxiliary subunit
MSVKSEAQMIREQKELRKQIIGIESKIFSETYTTEIQRLKRKHKRLLKELETLESKMRFYKGAIGERKK